MTTCTFPGCNRSRFSTFDLCQSHHNQQRHEVSLRPIGKTTKKHLGFSDTMTCVSCGETKHWKSFVLMAENKYDECRDCYRLRLFTKEEVVPVNTMQDALDFIDEQIARSKRK